VHDPQIFGDLKLAIDWMKNFGLQHIAQLHTITAMIDRFMHIPREHNTLADTLSKDALLLVENNFVLEEHFDGGLFSIKEDVLTDL
jgi:hypothetical protein